MGSSACRHLFEELSRESTSFQRYGGKPLNEGRWEGTRQSLISGVASASAVSHGNSETESDCRGSVIHAAIHPSGNQGEVRFRSTQWLRELSSDPPGSSITQTMQKIEILRMKFKSSFFLLLKLYTLLSHWTGTSERKNAASQNNEFFT